MSQLTHIYMMHYPAVMNSVERYTPVYAFSLYNVFNLLCKCHFAYICIVGAVNQPQFSKRGPQIWFRILC